MSLTKQQKLGGIFAASAYSLWGLAPIYFKQIDTIPAAEILVHRILWSFLLLFLIVVALKQGQRILQVMRQPKQLAILLVCSVLLGINWGLFIWAVNNDHMLDASLGYYINPLLNVLLGMFFLGERLRSLQWLAVALAGLGVFIQLITFGSLPWVALCLASSFAVYGLLRKKLAVDAISGLFIESLLLLPLALLYWWQFADSYAVNLFNNDWQLNAWLIIAGVVTTVPLLCFIAGAQRLQLSTMGFFQYIGPSLMFVFGVWLYHEPFAVERLYTFGLIWTALLVYTADAWQQSRQRKQLRNAA
ncbi:EamA family transporter RarD [Rheinheimera sp. MMS21-TC3]|uniref:EamA family transporter RarD n=1 Tax=Rheinheimera sp. MMS21-TC3 TaxID=3072790 RepID=UPI0028C408AB|nr:EamA family transporter RarD [Rheinheimera sp. MMS21-TC3]WNO60308.1 EamA family transporter RarD [Rheinheimera sp. MMS21-TC3]